MNISTFRDENCHIDERLDIFKSLENGIKPIVYFAKDAPEKLANLIEILREQGIRFTKLFIQSLSDEEFFKIYQEFYMWNTDAIIAKHHQDDFPDPVICTLKTNDVTTQNAYYGAQDDSYNIWTEWHFAKYKVLANADFQFEDREYTKAEIAQLVQDKKLIVLDTNIPYGGALDDQKALEIAESNKLIDLPTEKLDSRFTHYVDALNDVDISEMHKNSPFVIPTIRQDLSDERLFNDYIKYLAEHDITGTQIDQLMRIALENANNPKADKAFIKIQTYLQCKTNQQTTETPEDEGMSNQ